MPDSSGPDSDESSLLPAEVSGIKKPVIVASSFKPERSEFLQKRLSYQGMEVKKVDVDKVATGALVMPGITNGILLKTKPDLVNFLQNPYLDSELATFEAAARTNHAVKSAIGVRALFVFDKGVELEVVFPEEQAEQMTKEAVKKKIDGNSKWKEAIKNIAKIDEQVGLRRAERVFYWQMLVFGRGLVLKLFDKDGKLKRLMPINSRRLGDPVLDNNNDMEYEGVIVDGQGVLKSSLIYGTYNDNQISAHTEYFGYSTLEEVIGVAQSLSALLEEDVPEITKSAWLATILLTINTMGLTEADAQSKIDAIIDAIKAGKIVAVNESAMDTKILDLKPDFAGIVTLIDKLEAIIFKAYHVPQFLVQNEGVANRATALQSTQSFLDGTISNDQEKLADIFQEQYYDPLLRQELQLPDEEELPFHIRRNYQKAKVADFIDLADGLVALKNAGIWDAQKANEVLDSEEVLPRLKAQQEQGNLRTKLDEEKLKLIQKMNGGDPQQAPPAKEESEDKPGDGASDPQ